MGCDSRNNPLMMPQKTKVSNRPYLWQTELLKLNWSDLCDKFWMCKCFKIHKKDVGWFSLSGKGVCWGGGRALMRTSKGYTAKPNAHHWLVIGNRRDL